jgi:alkylation response protein AidB-like acyl-CoA dehydrogenase
LEAIVHPGTNVVVKPDPHGGFMTSAVTTRQDGLVDEAEFRVRVRTFLEEHAPRARRGDDGEGQLAAADQGILERARVYQAALFDAGLAGLTWPKEYGGQGLPGRYQTIFNEEATDFRPPSFIYVIGFGMCIPTVLAHGTEDLKQRYVRPGARGEEVWCQLFSEPAAGSDVASLRSTAVRDGDEWVLNGQKVWTSGAHYCDYGIVLARTNPDVPKHKGLSMFIVDMRAPGVTIRPLRQMNGAANFNEVFFDGVRLRADHILGDPGEGWRVALTTLMNERVAIGAGQSTEKTTPLTPISSHLEMARSRGLTNDPVIRQELADLLIRYWVLDMVGLRIRGAVAAGRVPGPEGSVAKLIGALLSKRSAEVACHVAGASATAWSEDDGSVPFATQMVLSAPGIGIAGGTNEVMRNILGERVLGLPKEPQVDRDIPFRDLVSS